MYTKCSTSLHIHTWGSLFFFCARTHISVYIFDQHESAVTLHEIMKKYSLYFKIFSSNSNLSGTCEHKE